MEEELKDFVGTEHSFSWDSGTLLKLVKSHFGGFDKEMVGAEIGVHRGYLSAALLEKFPKLHLFMIDRWESLIGDPDYAMDEEIAQLTAAQYAEVLEDARSRTDFAKERRTILKMRSADAAKYLDETLDWAFIDACHRYERVKEDLYAWWDMIKPGGFLSGHDYGGQPGSTNYGVTKAVNEFVATKQLKKRFSQVVSCWMIRKT